MRRLAFVSGTFDPLHMGHVQFLKDARDRADHLVVCIPNDHTIRAWKHREPFLPWDQRHQLIGEVRCVDEVCTGSGEPGYLNFLPEYLARLPATLYATADDQMFAEKQRILAAHRGAQCVQLPKTRPPGVNPLSSTDIVRRHRAPLRVPLRVDLAGGWLDVPRLARRGAYIVNCTISPVVGLDDWRYERYSGLGGSAAWRLLRGEDAAAEELAAGVGWQDPAVIQETGLCVWRSGPTPILDFRSSPDFLAGHMALWWSGVTHSTPDLTSRDRDYRGIAEASRKARAGVLQQSVPHLADAVRATYRLQLEEGMDPMPIRADAIKYCGSGWGGYGLALFLQREDRDEFLQEQPGAVCIEPYDRWA